MSIALKEIHIANEKKRDANVRFVSLIKEGDPIFNYKGKYVKNARLLIGSGETSEDVLLDKYSKNLADKILKEDVDIDIEVAGKRIGDIDRIFLNSKKEILYAPPKVKEILFDKEGKEIKKQDPKEVVSNVRDDTPPLQWTGKFYKREEVLSKFVISKSIQLKHVDGLTYEFLYDMAKTLDEKKSLILLGGGSGKDPLIFQTNGTPYRGFLDGRINKKQYQLILRLSNMELKKV
ncbi:MAG: hypothetical protein O3B39_04230 [Proteobacteria bacterium]|nr:hypothetical protein [Pseudomonadota bacterium]